ncbi:MAG: hypothetical protein WCC97_14405 [Candidatus Acidiferrales bacterium]
MARLSEFQIPDAPIPVDANLVARNASAAASRVDWRNTKVFIGEGARESDPLRSLGFDRSPSPELRQRLHDSLDRVIDAEEEGEESEEQEDDAEPEEASDGWLHSIQRQLDTIRRRSDAEVFDVRADVRRDRERQRHASADHGGARVVPTRHEVNSNSYVTDSQFIARHLDPEQLCADAANALSGVSYRRQADDANRGYWSGLFFFLHSQPAGSRIKDVANKACLSTLLQHTVGGMQGAFGA